MITALLHKLVEAIGSPQAKSSAKGAWRLVLLLGLVFVLCIAPIPLSPGVARWLAPGLLLGGLLILGCGAAVVHHLTLAVKEDYEESSEIVMMGGRVRVPKPHLEDELHTAEMWLRLVRKVGMTLPALLFFCMWALIYITAWGWDPAVCPADTVSLCHGAFAGAGAQPIFGDFLYLSVNMAFANPAPDLLARTRLTHALGTVEVINGVGLATLFASSFFGLQGSRAPVSTPDPKNR